MEEGKDRSAVQKEVTDQYSLRGRVFHRIREDILSGKYSENEELKEATIGAECGVSRTPVREALRQLELEGLVKIVPNKGAYVTGISSKDTRDIYVIRSYLEGLAARWACEHISEPEIDTIEETPSRQKKGFYSPGGSTELATDINTMLQLLYLSMGGYVFTSGGTGTGVKHTHEIYVDSNRTLPSSTIRIGKDNGGNHDYEYQTYGNVISKIGVEISDGIAQTSFDVVAQKDGKFIDIVYGLSNDEAKTIFALYEELYPDNYYILAQNGNYVYCVSDKTTFRKAGFTTTANVGEQYISGN